VPVWYGADYREKQGTDRSGSDPKTFKKNTSLKRKDLIDATGTEYRAVTGLHAGGMRMKTVNGFARAVARGHRICMATCYDAWSARLLKDTPLDAILVGDSVAMVMHGYPSTVSATTEMLAMHTAAVRRGDPDRFLVTDVPFPEHRKGVGEAMACVDALAKAGAQAVKIEGVRGHEAVIEGIIGSGIPVMGHLGLTPQSVNQFGGYAVQGKSREAARKLLAEAIELERLGAFAVVLECVPAGLAKVVSERLTIPTIGIGSGPDCDGQVLVLQDLLGMQLDFRPKFLRTFMEGGEQIQSALKAFDAAVKDGTFPAESESFEGEGGYEDL